MKVIDLINLVAKLLNEYDIKKCVQYCLENNVDLETFLNLLLNNDGQQKIIPEFLNGQSDKDLRLILDCINIVNLIIFSEYKPLFITEEIEVKNNEFIIDNLSQQLFKIKQITKNNVKQKYSINDSKIMLSNGKFLITYSYLPNEVGFNDFVKNIGNVSLLTIAYGVCSQFCLIKCLYEESKMWNSKFEYSLQNNLRPIKSINIKGRRWL